MGTSCIPSVVAAPAGLLVYGSRVGPRVAGRRPQVVILNASGPQVGGLPVAGPQVAGLPGSGPLVTGLHLHVVCLHHVLGPLEV